MQQNQKVKSIIILCITAVIVLLVVSIALMINIHIAKKELANQEQQISKLEQIIDNYENLPESGSSEIIPEGEN